jgi:hypothetical protein
VYNTGKRIAQAQQLAGMGSLTAFRRPRCCGVLLFRLNAIYYQSQFNRLWAQQ